MEPEAERITAVAGRFRCDGCGGGGLARWSSRWEIERYKEEGGELGEGSMASAQLESTFVAMAERCLIFDLSKGTSASRFCNQGTSASRLCA